MTRLAITVTAWLLSSTFLNAQPSGGPADQTDHPSNSLFEMKLSPIFPQVRAAPSSDPDRMFEGGVWNGEVAVTIKNISRSKLRLVRRIWWWQYSVEVLDSDNKPVPLTPYGEGQFPVRQQHSMSGPVSLTDLEPSQEFTEELDLATIFQIKRGGTFTIKVRRSRDLPQVDFTGTPLRELSVTLVVKGGPGGRDN